MNKIIILALHFGFLMYAWSFLSLRSPVLVSLKRPLYWFVALPACLKHFLYLFEAPFGLLGSSEVLLDLWPRFVVVFGVHLVAGCVAPHSDIHTHWRLKHKCLKTRDKRNFMPIFCKMIRDWRDLINTHRHISHCDWWLLRVEPSNGHRDWRPLQAGRMVPT